MVRASPGRHPGRERSDRVDGSSRWRPVLLDPLVTPYGRDAELVTISAMLADAQGRGSTAAAALVGPAGAGKTTLWRAAVAMARARGFTVLVCAPAATEASLGLAGLADLLRDVSRDWIETLPAPQRNALRAVLLETQPDEPVTDRAISAGLRTLLDALAADHPVCLAIDDIQWMDRSSQRALAFALRRIDGRSILVLTTRRDEPRPGRWSLLDALPEGSQELRLGPLSVGALHHVLLSALGTTFPHPALTKIADWSGGNPLLAIELGRSLAEGGMTSGMGRAPLTGPGVQRFLGRRVATLPAEQRRTLLVVALAEQGSRQQVEQAHARLGWRLSLPDASSGLIEATERTLRLAHPLFGEAVLAGASIVASSSVRRTLAAMTHRADVRARHLAEASSGPDEDIAHSLDAAAADARARGATAEALDLAGLALRRSSPGSSRHHARTMLYATLLFQAGDLGSSERVLEGARAAASSDSERVSAMLRLAHQGRETRPASYVIQVCKDAIRLAGSDAISAAEAHLIWAQVAVSLTESQRHVRAALRLLGPSAPARIRARAMILRERLNSIMGRAVDLRPIDAAVELDRVSPPERVTDRAQFTRAWLLLMADELSRARDDFSQLRRLAEEVGDESSMPSILANAGHLEIRAGNWKDAHAIGTELLQVSERSGQRFWAGLAHAQLGSVATLRGEVDIASEHLARGLAIGVELEDAFIRFTSVIHYVMRALGDERYEDAATLLAGSDAQGGEPVPDPGMTPWPGLAAEVLARVGRLSEAVLLADDLEARARRARRRRALGAILRIRSLVASAEGDLDLAERHALESSRLLSRMPAPFDHARSLLVLGTIQRRKRKRGAADTTLAEAARLFELLGAPAWHRQALAERARTGLRPRAPAGLTPTEATVARLAADGLTNREVAQAAFMSPKTVEANLTRVYQKLGIRTRAELGRRLDALTTGAAPAPAD